MVFVSCFWFCLDSLLFLGRGYFIGIGKGSKIESIEDKLNLVMFF